MAACVVDLAKYQEAAGNFAVAESLAVENAARQQKLEGERSAGYANTLSTLSVLADNRSNHALADSLNRIVVDIRGHLNPNSSVTWRPCRRRPGTMRRRWRTTGRPSRS